MSTAKWANIGDDPGALHALVDRIPEHAPVATIDYIWLFPARTVAAGESVVVVIGVFDDDPERRRVSTAHFTVSRNRKGAATVNVRFDEHGSAPVAAVPRIVQGVLRRLGEDAEASPREEQINGEQARWDELIVEIGGAPRIDDVDEDGTDGAADDDAASGDAAGGGDGDDSVLNGGLEDNIAATEGRSDGAAPQSRGDDDSNGSDAGSEPEIDDDRTP